MSYSLSAVAAGRRIFFGRGSVFLGMLVSILGLLMSMAIPSKVAAVEARNVYPDFRYTFNSPGVLLEAGDMGESSSPYFWVNSGGKLVIGSNGAGGTIQGVLAESDPFRLLYSAANSVDTDGGYYPQNIFRLLTRSQWGSSEQELSFRITGQNLSDSPNRQGYNGILLMSRYGDGDNLYYAGIRNDGQAVIKKKVGGTYHTLAMVQIFGVEGKYDRESIPTLLPRNKWMRMKLQSIDRGDDSVYLRLLIDREDDGTFVSILSAVDDGVGGRVHDRGYAGVRTDFMDVEFRNIRVREL